MKKESILLWIASTVIVFLTVYFSNLINEDYPITSTIGIDGNKVSYRFEKIHYGKDTYRMIIRSDLSDLTGKLFWKSSIDTLWHAEELQKSNLVLRGDIPALKPTQNLLYFAELYYKESKYIIPDNQKVTLTFFGKIPIIVTILEFLLLYLGLLFSVRTGLDNFNEGRISKKLGMITVIIFLPLNALINPLYITYKYGFINTSIPPINKLFLWGDLSIFILWVITLVAIFRSDKLKKLPLVTAALSVIIFVVFR